MNVDELWQKAIAEHNNGEYLEAHELFEAAGGKFAFDEEMLTYAVNLIDSQIKELNR